MTYLIILGAIELFGAGVFVGSRFGAAAQKKVAAIESELKNYTYSVSTEAKNVVAAIKQHL